MIIDSLDNLSLYTHLHPGFEKAAAYLQSHDLMTLPQGTIEVDGRSVYILSQINTLENTEPRFEAHAKYADIQLILDGCERFAWTAARNKAEIDPEKDVGFFSVEPDQVFVLPPKHFVIFLPGEGHAPCLKVSDVLPCRKLVVKIRMCD